MKYFTITKTGYTYGQYGCTGEYFTLIYTSKNGFRSEVFGGMYGAERRVADVLKEAGYEENYVYSNYGRLTRKDIVKSTLSEYSLIEQLKKELES
jgi:hypothetical protein